jgi:hypothetical protein
MFKRQIYVCPFRVPADSALKFMYRFLLHCDKLQVLHSKYQIFNLWKGLLCIYTQSFQSIQNVAEFHINVNRFLHKSESGQMFAVKEMPY